LGKTTGTVLAGRLKGQKRPSSMEPHWSLPVEKNREKDCPSSDLKGNTHLLRLGHKKKEGSRRN